MEYGEGIEKGSRIEISPHYDLWMKGARTGTVVAILDSGSIAKVKMDNANVKKLQKFLTIYCKRI